MPTWMNAGNSLFTAALPAREHMRARPLCLLGVVSATTVTFRVTASPRMSAPESVSIHPKLLVFDLDACLWDKEMFEMEAIPTESDAVFGDLNGRGTGCVGVMSAGDKISLHRGALLALQEHADGRYPGMRVALASSANTPFAERVGRKALTMLEVLPGLTVWDLLMRDWDGVDVNQIGRQPPLSPNKAETHFPFLRKATGIGFDQMLFFDDCNWSDHCAMVADQCKEASGFGVVTLRTPRGLGVDEWRAGLEAWRVERRRGVEP